MLESRYWRLAWDGHPDAYDLYLRSDGPTPPQPHRTRMFVGPGAKLVLIGPDGGSLFAARRVWRGEAETTVHVVAFANWICVFSDALIRDAMNWIYHRWGFPHVEISLWPYTIRHDETLAAFIAAGWSRNMDDRYGRPNLEYNWSSQ